MYKLYIIPSAKKDLDSLDNKVFDQIKEKIIFRSEHPRSQGCIKLTGEEGYRLRSSKYRLLYRIDDKDKIIYIYRIKHRKDAHK